MFSSPNVENYGLQSLPLFLLATFTVIDSKGVVFLCGSEEARQHDSGVCWADFRTVGLSCGWSCRGYSCSCPTSCPTWITRVEDVAGGFAPDGIISRTIYFFFEKIHTRQLGSDLTLLKTLYRC